MRAVHSSANILNTVIGKAMLATLVFSNLEKFLWVLFRFTFIKIRTLLTAHVSYATRSDYDQGWRYQLLVYRTYPILF